MDQAVVSLGIIVLSIVSLAASNLLVDRGVDVYVTRRLPATVGGVAFLAGVLWLEVTAAIGLPAAISGAIILYRFRSSRGLRGTRGSLPSQPYVDINFILAGTVSLTIGWAMLDDRWLGFMPIAFMAWGDTVSGLVSAFLSHHRARMSFWPSTAMLTTCLVISLFYSPYWVAANGSTVATVAERFPPKIGGIQDDNWVIVGASLGVMAAIQAN